MGLMTDQLLGKEFIQPVFISCDPARDTVAQVKRYVSGKCRQTLFLKDFWTTCTLAVRAYTCADIVSPIIRIPP